MLHTQGKKIKLTTKHLSITDFFFYPVSQNNTSFETYLLEEEKSPEQGASPTLNSKAAAAAGPP